MKENSICMLMTEVFLPLALLAQANWVYRYNGSGDSTDVANSIVYGADGHIYAAGSSWGGGTYQDFMVISLTTAGDTNWVYQYNGSASGGDVANSIVHGADGNLYAAGYSEGSGTYSDFTVISLTTAGDTNWVYRYDGPANFIDGANSIVYGGDGNIYAAGRSWCDGAGDDFTVISLTTAGDTNWVYRYNGPWNGPDGANSIVYGGDGSIYAAGYSYGSGTYGDFTVISLTTAGDTNWVYQYNGSASGGDVANSIVYGADGNLYVAGSSNDSVNYYDFTVISLTTAGDVNWVYRYNGPGNGSDEANSIVYGADGNIYATGFSEGSGTSRDFTVISLTTAGDTNWVYRYNGPGNGSDGAYSIVYGGDGSIYAAGYSYGSGTYGDCTVISLTTAGDTNWVYQYNGSASGGDEANSIVYGADGNIYAAGYSAGIGTGTDFTVISLPPDLGVEEKAIYCDNSSYSATIFSGPLVLPKDKQCKVFDITGRTVTPDKLTPGVYFIEVDGQIVQKVIKIR